MASLYIYWPSVEQVMDSDTYQTTAEKLWLSRFVFVVAEYVQGYNKLFHEYIIPVRKEDKRVFLFVCWWKQREGNILGPPTCSWFIQPYVFFSVGL